MDKEKEVLEIKSFIEVPIEFKEDAFSEDDNFHYVKAYATTFDLDLGGDIVMPGATKKSLKKKSPKVLLHHDSRLPVGAHMKAIEDENGVLIQCKIPKDGGNTPFLVPYLKCGAVSQLSIGYFIKKYEMDTKKGIRKITELEFEEYSFVLFPMNPNAKVVDVKFNNGTIRELEKGLRDAGLSNREAKTAISVFNSFQRDAGDSLRDVVTIDEECSQGDLKSHIEYLNSITKSYKGKKK
tara:strand:+ start:2355 stop:3068 length:714 start_codon:yes stop_codon:yes gene_type:complete